MKIKTAELLGAALDWAVAKCEGAGQNWGKSSLAPYEYYMGHRYSTNWAQGGPIIEREGIVWRYTFDARQCVAFKQTPYGVHQNEHSQYGPTPLIAAMRCYVASKLGDEVEVPEELL